MYKEAYNISVFPFLPAHNTVKKMALLQYVSLQHEGIYEQALISSSEFTRRQSILNLVNECCVLILPLFQKALKSGYKVDKQFKVAVWAI